jgi:hypothetical protein
VVILALGALLIGCSSVSLERGVASRLEERRLRLQSITEGMTTNDVLRICGPADEIRRVEKNRIHGEAERWAYGVSSPGSFAIVGLIAFGQEGRVIHRSCPSKGGEGARGAIVTNGSATTPAKYQQMEILIEEVRTNEAENHRLRQVARVSLLNRGENPWVVWGCGLIYDNCLIEVHDRNMNPLLCADEGRYNLAAHSAMKPRQLQLEFRDGVCQEFPIWLTEDDFGKPESGTY